MIITSIEEQKKNKDRVNIFIDQEFAFGLEKEILYKYKLKANMELDYKLVNELLQEEQFSSAMNKALNYLSYRQRTEKELGDYLKKQEFNEFILEDVIYKCRELGYLNDQNFAESFVRDKMNINNYGPMKIRQELYLKGIDNSIINQALDNEYEDEYENALELARKRIRSYKNDDFNSQYRKLAGYLQRRGFSFDVVRKVLDQVLKNDQ